MTHPTLSLPARWAGMVSLLLLATAPADAGPAFFAGRLEDGRFVRDETVSAPCFTIRYSTLTATVAETTATIEIQETVVGPQQAVRTVCLIPLADGADGASARVRVARSGRASERLTDVRFLSPQAAQPIYESLARGQNAVDLLAFSGRGALLVPQFELQGSIEITVEFRTAVPSVEGVQRLACPLPATAWAGGPVERLSLGVTIRSQLPLRAVFSPTHPAVVQRRGLSAAAVQFKAEHWAGREDFRLLWVADRNDLGLRVLAHHDGGAEDGYFLLIGNPTGSAHPAPTVAKDVLFVLDTSGSMRGEKLEQARAAIGYCLRQLAPHDRFNIVGFGTEVTAFRDTLAEKTPADVAAAERFVDALVAQGRTNISGALAKTLASPAAPGRPRIALFLTDGTPTAGELVPDKIVDQVRAANASGTRIFVMGVGHDVNAHLLDKLAEVSDGSSEYAGAGEELDAQIAALYDRLAHPVLTGVTVGFGELATHSVYPPKLPVLFRGSEIMIAGRYRGGGPATFTISGTLSGQPVQYTCQAELPQAASGSANHFLPTLWAARKIGFLLQEIRLHGENQELIEEVVRLSRRFGILTEYTEFLALAPANLSAAEAVRQARTQMAAARAQQAGQWAVNQAFNDQQLQQRAVATGEANTFRDRRGNVVRVDTVSQVGRQVFYLRDGQWVDAEDAGPRPTRVVRLFSPEYFDLLRSQPAFAQSQQLGWAVSMNVGQERIVVEKDGRQQDERLRRPAAVPEEPPPPQLNNQFPQQQQAPRGLR